MKIDLIKQTGGHFIPCTDNDMEMLTKLKNGEHYSFEVKQLRKYKLHKKYFSLISCAWDCLNENEQDFFINKELFRKTVEIAAGHCERIYSLKQQDFVNISKSVSFASMDNTAFQTLYENVKNVIFDYVLKGKISEEDFIENLLNY